jgi:hypothetical protein
MFGRTEVLSPVASKKGILPSPLDSFPLLAVNFSLRRMFGLCLCEVPWPVISLKSPVENGSV